VGRCGSDDRQSETLAASARPAAGRSGYSAHALPLPPAVVAGGPERGPSLEWSPPVSSGDHAVGADPM